MRLTVRWGLLSMLAAAAIRCGGDDTTTGGTGGGGGSSGAAGTAAGAAGSSTGGSSGSGGAAGTSGAAGTGGSAGTAGSAAGGGGSAAEAGLPDTGAPETGTSDASDAGPKTYPGLDKINHVVVVYMENWSFDSLYGEFAGAEGLTQAYQAAKQVDKDGVAYTTLPQVEPALGGVVGDAGPTPAPDGGVLAFPNSPFALEPYLGLNSVTKNDLVHRFYHEQIQINGGKMDSFVSISNAQGMVMGYFHTAELPLAAEAHKYTLCDHFFHAAFGGSFLNHIWLIAAATPSWPNGVAAPSSITATVDLKTGFLARDPTTGLPVKDGFVTPDQ